MSMVISTYRLRREDNLADVACSSSGGSRTSTMQSISNISWLIDQETQQESTPAPPAEDDTEPESEPEPEPTPEPVPNGEVVQGGSAPSLTSGDCGEDCTECASFYYENKPNEPWYQCVDTTVYVYNLQCSGSKDMSKCATGNMEHCFQSYTYPRQRSQQPTCRTLPDSYINGEFDFNTRRQFNSRFGLCLLGCEGKCYISWRVDDDKKWRGPTTLARCKLD